MAGKTRSRIEVVICAALVLLAAEAPFADSRAQGGSALRLNKHVVTAGEQISAEVHVANVLGYHIAITSARRPAKQGFNLNPAYPGERPDGSGPFSGTFVHTIETTDLLAPQREHSGDPYRDYFDVTLYVLPATGGSFIPAHNERIFVKGDAERLSADEFQVKSPARQNWAGPEVIADVTGANEPRTAELVRLGRYLPGGAVAVDHAASMPVKLSRNGAGEYRMSAGAQFYDLGSDGFVHLSPGPAAAALADSRLPKPEEAMRPERLHDDLSHTKRGGRFSISSPIGVGNYEFRAVAHIGAMIGRSAITVAAPRLANAVRLTPPNDKPYSFQALPAVDVQLPDALDDVTKQGLVLSVARIGRAGVLEGPVIIAAASDLVSDGSTGQSQMVLSEADVTQAGSYEVRLSSAGILLDRQVFDVGGTPPDWVTPLKAIGPDIAVEDVRVESANEVAVWQDPFAVAVKDNAGRALTSSADESLIASLYYLGHYTYGCAWSEGYYGASALVTDGKAMLPAPAEPGPYEIRVFRTLAFNGVPEDKLPPIAPAGLWSPASLQLIGVGHIKAVAPDAPGAIALSAAALAPHDTLNISVALPAQGRNPHAYQLELWLAGDRFPGGVLRAPTIYKSASISGARMTDADGGRSGYSTIAIEAPESKIVVDPLIVPGDYEIRLFDRTTGFHVARAPFAVRDPGPPAMPADARFVRNAITDWPAKEDPLRGLEAWYKPKDACEDPVFPEPPQLRLAELYSSDPENADDDQYVAVTSVQPGHPIFVEAEFTQAPPDDVYRVKVDGERKIRVFRTDNPRLYRSKLVTMIPNKAAP